jgi:hypothetical protein
MHDSARGRFDFGSRFSHIATCDSFDFVAQIVGRVQE